MKTKLEEVKRVYDLENEAFKQVNKQKENLMQ